MSKKLIVIRHAKSSWDTPGISDFDRPLNGRGRKNAPEMGRRLKQSGIQPDLMLSSPARRAISTAQAIAAVLGYPAQDIATDFDLYLAGAHTILRVLRGQNDAHKCIMLFSHNEGITDFANMLSGHYLDNLPTAGVIGFTFRCASWSEIAPHKGKFCFYDYPRNEVVGVYKL